MSDDLHDHGRVHCLIQRLLLQGVVVCELDVLHQVGRLVVVASRGSLGLRFDGGDVGHERISRTIDPLTMHGLGRHLAEGRGRRGGSAASGLTVEGEDRAEQRVDGSPSSEAISMSGRGFSRKPWPAF